MARKGIISFDVLISCPGDVNEYLEPIKKSVEDFNDSFGSSNNIRVETKHWKKHSYPESGGSPQKLLNDQLVNKCDFAIAMFWTRFGSPTDKYGSGTEEEIEIMLGTKRQVFMYFLDAPINPSHIDIEQYQKIKDFKAKYKDKGIFWIVANKEDLKEILNKHLQLYFSELLLEKEITFDSNGGNKVASQTVRYNDLVSEPVPPTRAGYSFSGWFTDTGLSKQFVFTTPITESIKLYAKWDSESQDQKLSSDGSLNVWNNKANNITVVKDITIFGGVNIGRKQ